MRNLLIILFALITSICFGQRAVYGDLNIYGKLTAKDTLVVGDDILPDSTAKRSLGSQSLRFKKLWLGGGSIDMGGRLISLDAIDNGVEFQDTVSDTTCKTNFKANLTLLGYTWDAEV